VHARAHGFDQFPDFGTADFREAQRAGALAQNGISNLDDFKFHGIHNGGSQNGARHTLPGCISIREDIREERRRKMKS